MLMARVQMCLSLPIKDDVSKGLYAYLNRAINEAEEKEADLIIFDMHTPGGAVDAACDIGNRIANTDVKTITFVNSWAISAGAYIALYTDEIYMTKNAVMGAAAVIDSAGNTAGEKAESMWLAAMEGAANRSERDPDIAKAMASADIDLPKLKKNGKLLTLNADQAFEVGYSEGTVRNIDELLQDLGYQDASVRTIETTFAESLGKIHNKSCCYSDSAFFGKSWAYSRIIFTRIWFAGSNGIELFTAILLRTLSWRVLQVTNHCFCLFLGLVLIGAEFFLPGGIAGTLGAVAVIGSMLMAGGNISHMAISIIIALVMAILFVIIMVKVFGKRMNIFRRLILTDSTSTESGYVSNVNRLELIGRDGITITPLRPSGTVKVDDERLDVVAEGGFIEKDIAVKVIKVEGSRIVVREV